jgi:hypothetical protein
MEELDNLGPLAVPALRYATMACNDGFSYNDDAQIEISGQDEIFHHRDANTLHRVSA